ncbi:MAG: trimeric autotransporter adhesin, partial [Thermoproteota archaeon]|nr:trimeric autotransporter adhesin [Thermoproteota archaeon]
SVTATFTENPITYSLSVNIVGSGSVTKNPNQASYASGSVVSVQATPSSGWTFNHWLLDNIDVGSTNPYTVTMNANHNLTALFTRIQYALHVQVGGSGVTNATGDTLHDSGASVRVLATASSGWEFNHWLLDNTDVSGANPYVLTVYSTHNLTAVFTEIPPTQYALHVQVSSSGSTNTTGNTLYNAGVSVRVLATPNSGWTLSYWLLDSSNVGSANPYSLTMNVNHNLTAVFMQIPPNQYNLHIQVVGSGTTNATDDALYTSGAIVRVLASVNSGWRFDHWLFDTVNVGNINPYTLTMDGNHDLTAVFIQIPQTQNTLHVGVSGSGVTNASGDALYNAGVSVRVLATPNSGWTLSYWLLDNNNVGSASTYVVTMNGNHNLTAVFTRIQYALHVGVSGSGVTNASGDALYYEGASVKVLATVDPGWTLGYWLLDDVKLGSSNPYLVTMDSSHSLTAVFEATPQSFQWSWLLIIMSAAIAAVFGVTIYYNKSKK